MSVVSDCEPERLLLYYELVAVHDLLRLGAELVTSALERLAGGDPLNVGELVPVVRWQVEFLHRHHASEDELLWPMLRRVFPDDLATMDSLLVEHEALCRHGDDLDAAMDALTAAVSDLSVGDALAVAVGLAALEGLPAAVSLRTALAAHLDSEESVLRRLLPQVPDADVGRLREAVVAGTPRSGPDTMSELF